MKARIKATGEIVDLLRFGDIYYPKSVTSNETYHAWELDFIDEEDDTLDYWTRLEHQYAGMAMQGMLSGKWVDLIYAGAKSDGEAFDILAHKSKEVSHALVEKLKEEGKK